jgi:hypothetical protein
MTRLSPWRYSSFRRGNRRPAVAARLGVAYCRGFALPLAAASVPFGRGLAAGGRVGGRLIVKTFNLQ